jgi:DNA helicase II / ATP-dependent DNA helicase PcrA
MKQELSKEQKEIIFFNECEGALLVEASAGSGKTRILTERVRHLLTEKKDKFFSVLCLTFTNKAADEMKERLEDVRKLSERAFIGTFHEFCLNQIIRKQRQEIGLEDVPHIFDDNDRKKILEDVFLQNELFDEDYKNLEPKQQQQRLNDYLNVISEAKRDLVVAPEVDIPNWTKKRQILYNDYNDRMRNQNAMDYDDILLYAYRILVERPVVSNLYRRLYRYILVDEAQDLNFAQYHILRAICGDAHKNIMLVGDPKQAIYAFNGASAHYMQEEFVNDFGAIKLAIPHNYRSSAKVLELAQSIRPNGGIPNNYFTGISEILAFDNEQLEAQWIISKIKEWERVGVYEEKEIKTTVALDNIAILARNRYVFKELIAQLDTDEKYKDKFYLRKGTERFVPESQLIKIFDLGLRILVNPSDILHFNLLYQELGLQESKTKNRLETLLNLNQTENLSTAQQTLLNVMVELWKKLKDNSKWVDNALNCINDRLGEFEFADEEKLKIDYDIKEFLKLWKGFLKNTSSESQNLSNFRYFLALNSVDENKQGLALATIHTVKGLEYDIVFLMGMNEGVLPDYRAKDKKALAEERNNAYVAVTRAKKCIYVTYPKSRIMPWGGTKHQIASTFITK